MLSLHSRARIQADDVLDAMAAFLVARADEAEVLRMQGVPALDEEGLRMEMLYIA
jgi:predicted RNase H-like nuclease